MYVGGGGEEAPLSLSISPPPLPAWEGKGGRSRTPILGVLLLLLAETPFSERES